MYVCMKNQLVISRYNEDIQWIQNIDTTLFDIIVYNKGSPIHHIDIESRCKIIHLENIGRESHTYLYHIIQNYHHLPEYILFCQGSPFDHVRDTFLEELYQVVQSNLTFHSFSKDHLYIGYDPGKNKFYERGMLHNSLWENHHDIESPTFQMIHTLYPNRKNNLAELKIHFEPGANFAVCRKLIVHYPIDFYRKCIQTLHNSSNPVNPPEGHAFERLWRFIFTSCYF